jgi:hypothetical protein
MYGGFDVFKVYLGVKLHFTTKTYDYIQYGGKVNCKLETFTKRNDRYFFHKLSKQYGQTDILDFFVANFATDSKGWIGNLLRNDGRDIYLDYKKRKEAFAYHFRADCVRINDDFLLIIFLLMMVSFAIMDNIHDFYVYLFKKERLSRPSLCLTKSYRLVRIGIKRLPRKLFGLKSHLRLPD